MSCVEKGGDSQTCVGLDVADELEDFFVAVERLSGFNSLNIRNSRANDEKGLRRYPAEQKADERLVPGNSCRKPVVFSTHLRGFSQTVTR